MIEQLYTLLSGVGVEAITLTLTNNDNDNVQVVMQTRLHSEKEDCTDDVRKIRASLSAPIVVQGYVGEVDAHFTKKIQEYIDNAEAASIGITSNFSEKTTDIAKANAENTNRQAENTETPITVDITDPNSL